MSARQIIKRLIPRQLLRLRWRYQAWRFYRSRALTQQAVGQVDDHWRQRIADVLASPDNAVLPRVPSAGRLEGAWITMHNGLQVCANGYYGAGMLNLLLASRGVHEPQEEVAFERVATVQPEDCVMLELGAYWGFYSMSLLLRRPRARCYLVEPELSHLVAGRLNFRRNGLQGVFVEACVGNEPRRTPPTITVDSFCADRGIEHLHILHADIQGHELSMLAGARRMLSERRVDYVFISTHSNELHRACLA
ncbi:MAG TPA: FkbM family methyltransferase, partial [Verrucomicrobiota bacterium]|nr:FkbM family methyltransferase [Verrucomicrobiota bacterium]